jgi:hypothetical protein
MGQYYLAVNKTKREYVRSWDIGGTAKLFEWCAQRTAGIFPYLLRKSSEGGGGDIDIDDPKFAGRWAGDEIYLVGDYDQSKLYQTAQDAYRNISKELVEEYNKFVEHDDLKLDTTAQP